MNEKFNLVGVDGNAFSIMGYVTRAMRSCNKSSEDVEKYIEDAMSDDYNYLLSVSIEMIDELNSSLDK